VRADNPSWAEQQIRNQERQRQALQQQAQQGQSPQVLMTQRWEREWVQQHPGEPVPNLGQLEKMHRGEIFQNTARTWTATRQNRQIELKQQYLLSRQNQQRRLDAQHITWSPQQWQNWDAQYQGQMKQNAADYLEGVRQAGEIGRMQEEERKRREIGGY